MSRALPVDQAYDQAAFPTTSSEELRSASEHPTNRPCVLLPQSVRVKLEPAMAPRERTFIMVKPDGVQRGLVGEIIARFENRGYKLVALKFMMAGDALLKEHYDDLAGKPFFNGLIKFMQTGPCVPMVWEGANAILTGRDMIGATNPLQAKLGTVRGDYCIQVGRNLIHGSDSVESAKKEIALWFKESELVDWKPQMESLLYE
ncbi:nucleoside diphosphate kinase-like [Dermacentor silvarum]|uniref:nucleoside diphosphate kinase-like n=1 Tax=Dermacentor silvarum TaxID=543639 RepID=UPI00189BDBB3|nr:nucleoside diphosphate kinase-like [Dermacentor silvarum]